MKFGEKVAALAKRIGLPETSNCEEVVDKVLSLLNEPHGIIMSAVKEYGVADTARRLGASRSALLSYIAGAARTATKEFIEVRAENLLP